VRAGAATCPARRRQGCGRSCAPAATSRATARPRARRRPGARATGARASACERAPDVRVARPPTLLLCMRARALLGGCECPRCARMDVRRRAAAQRSVRRGGSAQAGLSARYAPCCSTGRMRLVAAPGSPQGDASGPAPEQALPSLLPVALPPSFKCIACLSGVLQQRRGCQC